MPLGNRTFANQAITDNKQATRMVTSLDTWRMLPLKRTILLTSLSLQTNALQKYLPTQTPQLHVFAS
jgi:hypothetical protein